MKTAMVAMAITGLAGHAVAENFTIQISPRDSFTVKAPAPWILQQKKYNTNQDAEFSVHPKNKSFVLKMFFLRVDRKLDSKQKVKDRLMLDGQEFLEGSIQNKVEVKEMNLKKGYGFYATFTDQKTASNPNPKPTEYQHMTRGYIQLSDDTILGFWMLTHETDDKVFKDLATYLTNYIK